MWVILGHLVSLWQVVFKLKMVKIRQCENYQTLIDEFENAWLENYREFDMNLTNKVHVLISHVPQVIQRTGKGLFYQSEEVVEAAHAKFDKFWQRYKVIDVESDKHGENLLECVIDFVTKNI